MKTKKPKPLAAGKPTDRPQFKAVSGGAPAPVVKKSEVKIAAAKGWPMLTWIGKRPLTAVTAFPAHLVETFTPLTNLHRPLLIAETLLLFLLLTSCRATLNDVGNVSNYTDGLVSMRETNWQSYLQITLELEKRDYRVGEEIVLNIIMFNYSDTDVTIPILNPQYTDQPWVEVRSSNGQKVRGGIEDMRIECSALGEMTLFRGKTYTIQYPVIEGGSLQGALTPGSYVISIGFYEFRDTVPFTVVDIPSGN